MNTKSAQVKTTTPGETAVRGSGQRGRDQVCVKTVRFGELTVDPGLLITMPKGLLGFEGNHRYVIVDTADSEPFKWFQSLDDAGLAFVIVNPLVFFDNYRIDVDRRELDELKISDPASVCTYVIVSVPDGEMSEMSANLQGPILINTENNLAKQLVLVNGPYTTRHSLMEQVKKKAAKERRRAGPKTTTE